MFNSRHFDTLVRHVRFVKKKLCHIYDSSKSQKVHLRLAFEQCVKKGKIDFFLSQGNKQSLLIILPSDLLKKTHWLFRNRRFPTLHPHRNPQLKLNEN